MKPALQTRVATGGQWLQPHLRSAAYARTPEIRRRLSELGITLMEVHHVITRGTILWADDAGHGVHFLAQGKICDEVTMSVCAWFDCGALAIELIEVYNS